MQYCIINSVVKLTNYQARTCCLIRLSATGRRYVRLPPLACFYLPVWLHFGMFRVRIN